MTASTIKSEDSNDLDSNNSAISEPSSEEQVVVESRKRGPVGGRGGGKKARGIGGDLAGSSLTAAGIPLSISPSNQHTVQYQTANGILSVLAPFGGPSSSSSGVDMSTLGSGTTVIMTQDGQQFLIPVSLNDASLGAGSNSIGSFKSSNSNSSGSNASNGSPSGPNLTPQQAVMAEEAGRKREVRLLKNREAAKECRRKKKEYIKCLENRVAVLENQNKALIDELKSLKELYCKSTPHD